MRGGVTTAGLHAPDRLESRLSERDLFLPRILFATIARTDGEAWPPDPWRWWPSERWRWGCCTASWPATLRCEKLGC